jgi:hypothetical protein
LVITILGAVGLSFPRYFGYGMALKAEELTEKPDKFVTLTEPDPFVLEAISNPGKTVIVGSWEDSEFDEIVSMYETNNVKIDSKYYRITIYSVDIFIWGQLMLLSMIGWPIFGIAIVVWKLYMRRRHKHN